MNLITARLKGARGGRGEGRSGVSLFPDASGNQHHQLPWNLGTWPQRLDKTSSRSATIVVSLSWDFYMITETPIRMIG